MCNFLGFVFLVPRRLEDFYITWYFILYSIND